MAENALVSLKKDGINPQKESPADEAAAFLWGMVFGHTVEV